MSHVSISRSYAVLVGLEAYVKTRRRGKKFLQNLVHHRDKLLDPEEVAKRDELERDKSESAARERRFLERQQQVENEERKNSLMGKIGLRSKTNTMRTESDEKELGHEAEA